MKAVSTSKTSYDFYENTRRYIPADDDHYDHVDAVRLRL
jgi:hypothetical protein